MQPSYRFGSFELQPAQRSLVQAGKPVALGGRAFDVLTVLVERRGLLVTRAELLDRVWGRVVVEDSNLHVQVSALRKLLGPAAIATLPGRGYRFEAVLQGSDPANATPRTLDAADATAWLAREVAEPLPPLLGREHDLAALLALWPAQRLVNVVGAGGVGKTRLARAALALPSEAWPDGAAVVELAPLADAALIPGAIAVALRLNLGGAGDPLASLAASVRPLRVLLLLDNAEHLAEGVARVAQALLQARSGLHLLVTSQRPLKLPGERLFRLGGLALPPVQAELAQARSSGAVALFIERVQALDRHFELGEHNLGSVVEICRQLDGIPLALELAAARCPVLGVHGVAAHLGARFRLLRSQSGGVPSRQQTLLAAMDWSHSLLGDAQQVAFRRLGVFTGHFGLAMARDVLAGPAAPGPAGPAFSGEASAGSLPAASGRGTESEGEGESGSESGSGSEPDDWAAIDLLADLVDRSLVAVEGGEPPRYRLLETGRAYALERLLASGEEAAVRQRHAAAVRRFFETGYEDGWQLSETEFLARYEAELDNLRAALAWALQHEPGCAVALVAHSARLWRYLSLHPEALRSAAAALAVLDDSVPRPLAARLWECSAQLAGEVSNTESGAAASRAAELYARLGDRRGRYVALAHLAFSYRVSPKAEAAFAEMQQLEEPSWPPAVRLLGAKVEGGLATVAGRIEQARAANQRRLALATTTGSDRDAFAALGNLADVALVAGDAAQAVALGRALLARLGRRHLVTRTIALSNLLLALLALPDAAAARACAAEFVEATRQLDFMYLQWAGEALALLAALEGRWLAAATLLGYSDAVFAAEGAEREPNESRAHAQATALVAGASPAGIDLALCRAQGAALTPAAVCRWALQAAGEPPPG